MKILLCVALFRHREADLNKEHISDFWYYVLELTQHVPAGSISLVKTANYVSFQKQLVFFWMPAII